MWILRIRLPSSRIHSCGIAVLDDVADVEVGPDPGAVELVDVAGELDRAEEELVPDLLDGDLDPVLLGVGDQLADVRLRARVGVAVARPSC